MKYLIILLSFPHLINPLMDILRVKPVRTLEEAHGAEFFAYDFIGLAQLHGRKADEHNVTTEDGYILTVFRLLPNSTSSNETERRPVIFMQHGWGARSETFTFLGPGRSLAYTLSDAGYDVWLGNFRGNTYNRRHTTLSPDDAEFWDFSLDEYGYLDTPAMLDYVLNVTGQQKLTYVGYSVGCTAALILLSEKVEYNDKLNAMILLAPVAFFRTKTIERSTLAIFGLILQLLLPRTTEAFYLNIVFPWGFKYLCPLNRAVMALCKFAFQIFFGLDEEQFNLEDTPEVLLYYPSGFPLKVAFHFQQLQYNGWFKHYDYYFKKYNYEVYGSNEPPEYNLSRVTAPMVIFHGKKDIYCTEESVKVLLSSFSKDTVVTDISIEWDKFNHGDFLLAKDVDKLVNRKVLEEIEKFH